jgi:hypothetical protein
VIPSAPTIKRLQQSLEKSGVRLTEKAQNHINFVVEKGDLGQRVGFESQLRTAKIILDRGIVDPENIVIEPDVDTGDVDVLVDHGHKTYHLQIKAGNFYSSENFFQAANNKVKEFYESIKDSSRNAAYDILYKSPEEMTAEVTRLPSAPGSAARMQFSPDFYGDKIRQKIRSVLQKSSQQLGSKEGPLQFNVAVVGTHSFLAAGDDTYYRETLRELQENPRDYLNIDLVLIQSLTLNMAKRVPDARLLPLRNPHTQPEFDTHIFGETEDVQLYNIRFAVFPYHISEPGEHRVGIKDGRLHVDGHTGHKII